MGETHTKSVFIIIHSAQTSFTHITNDMGLCSSKQDTSNAPNHQNLSMQKMMCTGNATPNQSSGRNPTMQGMMCTGNATPNHKSSGKNPTMQGMKCTGNATPNQPSSG